MSNFLQQFVRQHWHDKVYCHGIIPMPGRYSKYIYPYWAKRLPG